VTVNAPVSIPLVSIVQDVGLPVPPSKSVWGPVAVISLMQLYVDPGERYPEPEIAIEAPSPPLFGVRTNFD
jgi:hypothetical protein